MTESNDDRRRVKDTRFTLAEIGDDQLAAARAARLRMILIGSIGLLGIWYFAAMFAG